MRGIPFSLGCVAFSLATAALSQAPVRLTIDTASRGYTIPADFAGLGFETRSVVANSYGVSGWFFTPSNTQLVTLFRNIGLKNIRVGGGTVDASGETEHCVTPTPTFQDIDNLFEFARAAGIKVIYSVRLLNLAACPNPNLPQDDAKIVSYIWSKYRAEVESFSIGNEPDVRSFHSRPDHMVDPTIVEANPGVSGSAYPSYLAEWRRFADVIHRAVPEAKFSGPETAVSATSSFTPDPANGVSWTQQFAADLKSSGLLVEGLQHHYVWGGPGNTTTTEAIDDMLSPRWDTETAVGMQPAKRGGTADFNPYPFVYTRVLAGLASYGIPYRMTEANDCLHGVTGASDGFASALWALDYMHWWAAHGMAGVNFHNNPWLPTDTVVPTPNPCASSGCANYHVTAKGYGIKAFDLGSHGSVEPIILSNPSNINLTAYAVGTNHELYVTVINRTHNTTHDTTDAHVTIQTNGFHTANASSIVLTDGEPGNADSMNASLGGATITAEAPWQGNWTPLHPNPDGTITLTVQSTTAAVVRLQSRR